MYQERHRNLVSLSVIALVLSSAGFAGMSNMFGLGGGGPSYPIPSGKGSRGGSAAFRRDASRKKRKRAQRTWKK